ncbi:MAG: hypothetical protein ACRDGI_08425 [Candidatus Limnocylindrales bacterium]
MRSRGQRLQLDRDQVGPVGQSAGRSSALVMPSLHANAMSLLDLQRLAGNQAVAAEIGAWRNGRMVIGVSGVDLKTHPSDPPGGVRAIRESRGGGGLLGRTVASIDQAAPLLRAAPATKTDKGWTAQAHPTRVPEPYLEQWWPTAGRHEMFPHVYLDVSAEWEGRIKAGEDEHARDHTVGWQVTWGAVGEAVNELAKAPGPILPTEEAATTDLWKRFKAALPADLRPRGDEPSDEAQQAIWGFDPKTTIFRRLFGATTARDTRNWHTTTSELDHQDGQDEIRQVAGDVHINETSSEDLIAEFRAKAAGGR